MSVVLSLLPVYVKTPDEGVQEMPMECDVVDGNPCWGEVLLCDVDYGEGHDLIEYYACEGHRHAIDSGEYLPAPVLQADDSVPIDTVLTGVIDTDDNGKVLP